MIAMKTFAMLSVRSSRTPLAICSSWPPGRRTAAPGAGSRPARLADAAHCRAAPPEAADDRDDDDRDVDRRAADDRAARPGAEPPPGRLLPRRSVASAANAPDGAGPPRRSFQLQPQGGFRGMPAHPRRAFRGALAPLPVPLLLLLLLAAGCWSSWPATRPPWQAKRSPWQARRSPSDCLPSHWSSGRGLAHTRRLIRDPLSSCSSSSASPSCCC